MAGLMRVRGLVGSICLWVLRLQRALRHGKMIFRVYLWILVIILGLGCVDRLQVETGGLWSGSSVAAYGIASRNPNGELKYQDSSVQYSFRSTPDAELQKYFDLNEATGRLDLRDGLRSINPQMNPTQTFPIKISPISVGDVPVSGREKDGKKEVNVYLTIASCQRYLDPDRVDSDGESAYWKYKPLSDQEKECDYDLGLNLSHNRPAWRWRILSSRKFKELKRWDKDGEGQAIASDVFWPNKSDQSPGKPSDTNRPVFEVVVLRESALPGLGLIDYSAIIKCYSSYVDNPRPQSDWSIGYAVRDMCGSGLGSVWKGGGGSGLEALWVSLAATLEGVLQWLSNDNVVIHLVALRFHVLMFLGLVVPGCYYLWRRTFRVVRFALQPYLLLLGFQILTILVAMPLFGDGLVLWVGVVYTSLRVLQLCGLLKEVSSVSGRRYWRGARRPRLLLPLLWCEFIVWSANLILISTYVWYVFSHWSSLSPA